VGDGEGEGAALVGGGESAAAEECAVAGEAGLESTESALGDLLSGDAGACGMLTAGAADVGAAVERGEDVAGVVEPPDPPELPPSKTIAHTTTTAHGPATTSQSLRWLGLRRRSARRVAEGRVGEGGAADGGAADGGVARQVSAGRGTDTAVGISSAGNRNVAGGSGIAPFGAASTSGGSASGDPAGGVVAAPVAAATRMVGSSGAPVPPGSPLPPNRIRGIRTVERTSWTWPISMPAAPQPGQETAPFRYLRQVLQ
jgi:hypothetical protein